MKNAQAQQKEKHSRSEHGHAARLGTGGRWSCVISKQLQVVKNGHKLVVLRGIRQASTHTHSKHACRSSHAFSLQTARPSYTVNQPASQPTNR